MKKKLKPRGRDPKAPYRKKNAKIYQADVVARQLRGEA